MTFPLDFSSSNLKVGNSPPARTWSGTLFMKLGSPASAGLVPASAAVVAAAIPAASAMKARLCIVDTGSLLRSTADGTCGGTTTPGTSAASPRGRPTPAGSIPLVRGWPDPPSIEGRVEFIRQRHLAELLLGA